MKAHILHKRFCLKDKFVRLDIPISQKKQLICSKDGYLFLKTDEHLIHKYMSDEILFQLPIHPSPITDTHATHLFKYNTIYIDFSDYIGKSELMGWKLPQVNFYYLYKSKRNSILLTLNFSDFKEYETTSLKMTRSELENFLYNVSNANGKYLHTWLDGIQYANSPNETITIDNKPFDFSNKGIVKKYSYNHKISSIYEIPKFDVTSSGYFGTQKPILFEFQDDKVIIYIITAYFICRGEFEVVLKKQIISPQIIENLVTSSKCKLERLR